MKKTPSPLIIRPGQIRRLNTNSDDRKTGNQDNKNHQKSHKPVSSYIISAAKKIGSIFSVVFIRHNKAGLKFRKDQVQHNNTGESSCKYTLTDCYLIDVIKE